MNKKISIEIIGSAKDAYEKLNQIVGEQKQKGKTASDEIKLWNGIQRAIELISKNPFYGENAKKALIPGYYIQKYGADNLFIVDLPLFWRMIYTITSDKIEIVCLILDIFDYDEYNKRSGFRKR